MVQRDVVQNVPVHHQQVAPPVIVKVKHARPERASQNICLPQRGSNRVVRERAVAVVAIKPVQLEIQMADEKIKQAIVHHVGGIGAHSRFRASFLAKSRAGFVRRIPKCAVSIIQIQKIALRIIRHENVRPAVAVKIRQHHRQALPIGVHQPRLRRHIRERPVAVVVIQPHGRAVKTVWVAIRAISGFIFSARHRMVFVILHVIRHQQIE